MTKRSKLLGAPGRVYQPWDRKFRLMRAEEGHQGGDMGANPGGGGDNTGGNAGGQSGDSSGANNGGQAFDLNSFWTGSDGSDNSGAASGGSDAAKSDSSGQQQQQQTQQEPPKQGGGVAEAIGALNFGRSVMTPEVMKELAEGNTDGFHKAMDGYGQQVATGTIKAMLPILSQLRDQLRSEMKNGLDSTLSNRDNMADLYKAIPSANNPALRPQVESIFNRAMTHTKNDRTAAIAMTKDMLKLSMTTMGSDLGIPPRSAGDGSAAVPSNTNWLEELAGR